MWNPWLVSVCIVSFIHEIFSTSKNATENVYYEQINRRKDGFQSLEPVFLVLLSEDVQSVRLSMQNSDGQWLSFFTRGKLILKHSKRTAFIFTYTLLRYSRITIFKPRNTFHCMYPNTCESIKEKRKWSRWAKKNKHLSKVLRINSKNKWMQLQHNNSPFQIFWTAWTIFPITTHRFQTN